MSFLSKTSKKYYLTLIFTENSLIAAKMHKSGKKLEYFHEVPLPPGSLEQNHLKDPESLLKLILDLKQKKNLADKFIIVGIPEEQCINHTLILPVKDSKEINQAIAYQADSFLPFPYEKECLDWMLIKNIDADKRKVLISAIPTDVLNDYLSILEKAGFQPISFESHSISLFRSIPPADRNLCFAVSVNGNSSLVLFCHDLSIEASSLLYDNSQIIPTIEKMLDFYLADENQPNARIPVYFSGQSALPVPAAGNLELKQLKCSVNNIPPGKENSLAPLISLLTKDVEPPEDEKTINIIPGKQLSEYENVFRESGSSKIKTILISLMIFLDLVMTFAIYQITLQTSSLKKTVHLNPEETANLEKINSYVQKTVLINKAVRQQKIFNSLPKIINGVQSLVEIKSLSYDKTKNEFTFAGMASSQDNLLKFKTELEKQKIFSKITLPWSSLERDSNIEFKVIAKI